MAEQTAVSGEMELIAVRQRLEGNAKAHLLDLLRAVSTELRTNSLNDDQKRVVALYVSEILAQAERSHPDPVDSGTEADQIEISYEELCSIVEDAQVLRDDLELSELELEAAEMKSKVLIVQSLIQSSAQSSDIGWVQGLAVMTEWPLPEDVGSLKWLAVLYSLLLFQINLASAKREPTLNEELDEIEEQRLNLECFVKQLFQPSPLSHASSLPSTLAWPSHPNPGTEGPAPGQKRGRSPGGPS